MASKKSKKNTKHMPAGESLARVVDETRQRLLGLILKMMNDVSEAYGDPERHQQTRRECASAIEAYAKYAEAKTGYQYNFNLQSKYSSDDTCVDESTAAALVVDTCVEESTAAALEACQEYSEAISTGDQYMRNLQSKYSSETVVDTFVEEPTVAAESSDPKAFANLYEEFVDKLNDMAGLLPVSKAKDVNVKVKEKEKTTVIKSGSDAKGEKVGAFKNLVGLEEQLLKMRFQSLHQNNRYISSTFQYKCKY
ncbi:PREDICTED: uncharacterized protein LOC109166660 [Ipomoea nil]|uniref:uncharacterized protein LOC109166660 n=1 Tax=Ipomoea nil TaxID=35883 RepID=UPI000901DBE8|nr:PREDICTED: uncharacterized protein LOC109166660 [Ipomoea nil]